MFKVTVGHVYVGGYILAACRWRVTSLDDFGRWVRGNGLEIVLLVLGAVLLARAVTWFAARLTSRIDAADEQSDAVVRSEAAKHRHSLTQVITWGIVVLIYSVTAVLVIDRLGVPLASLVAPATVAGVALGFGAQRIVQDILAGFFIITERQYGYGDLIRIAALGSTQGVTGTVEDVTLRTTRMRTVDGEVVFIPNGQINQVTNLSRDWARAIVDVPLPATADIEQVNELLQGSRPRRVRRPGAAAADPRRAHGDGRRDHRRRPLEHPHGVAHAARQAVRHRP